MKLTIDQILENNLEWVKDQFKENNVCYKEGYIGKKKYQKRHKYLLGYYNCIKDTQFIVEHDLNISKYRKKD
jgi:hypothetical protein